GPRVDRLKPGRELVADHQVRLLSAQPGAAHQQIVIRGRGQGLGQQDPTLQIVDLIVDRVTQIHRSGDQARVLVAQLDPDLLRAGQDVLVVQKVQRAAGSAELVPTRDRAGLGGKTVDYNAFLAEARG